MAPALLRSALFASLLALASCGGPDASALIGSGALEAEAELDSTSEALQSNAASVWFPMQEGNRWTLVSASGATRTIRHADVQGGMAWLTGLSATGEWVATSPDYPNTLYRWDDGAQAWGAYFRFGYAVTPWKVGSGACGTFTARRSATGVTVVAAAGTFAGARSIGFAMETQPNVRCAAPALSEVTFAPNVGPVMLKNGAGEQFLLKSAVVGGVVYPRPAGPAAKGTLKADKYAYQSTPNTIRCITYPCPSNEVTAVAKLTYTVTNTGASPQTWQFSSGKQLDVDAVDSAGKVVRRWSDGRMFTMALTSFTLAAGASKTFNLELELKDSQGHQLDGAYSLKAYLVPSPSAPNAAAQVPVSVSVQ